MPADWTVHRRDDGEVVGWIHPAGDAWTAVGARRARDGERTVSSLGDDLGLDSGTLSPMLRRLEARAFVQRQRDDVDERVVRVSLTDAGRTTHADVMDAVGCLVPAFQQGGDLGALVRQLAAITGSMRTLAGELRAAG